MEKRFQHNSEFQVSEHFLPKERQEFLHFGDIVK